MRSIDSLTRLAGLGVSKLRHFSTFLKRDLNKETIPAEQFTKYVIVPLALFIKKPHIAGHKHKKDPQSIYVGNARLQKVFKRTFIFPVLRKNR